MRHLPSNAQGKAIWTPFKEDTFIHHAEGELEIVEVLGYDSDRMYWLVLVDGGRFMEIDFSPVKNNWVYKNEVLLTSPSEWFSQNAQME